MKRVFLALLVVVMGMPAMAQENALWRDAFTAGVNYSFNVRDIKEMDYQGVALNGGYRKFLYWGLFVMPEVSLYWQQYDYVPNVDCSIGPGIPCNIGNEKLNRFGIGADALLGVRIPIAEKVGIDLMAGPYINWSFVNSGKDYDKKSDSFEIRGRFGLGVSILDKVSVNAFYDVAKTEIGVGYDKNRGNIVTVGVGYTF